MKLISLGSFDKKIFLILLIYLILQILTRVIQRYYFSKLKKYSLNISLSIIVDLGSDIFFIIPELIIKKNVLQKKKKMKIKKIIK